MTRVQHQKSVVIVLLLGFMLAAAPAHAQQTEPAAGATASERPAPEWTGLPFSSLADYERLIPIGMSDDDLVQRLGRPEDVMPGQDTDLVYHYGYQLADGSELRAVIILRDGAVFIRRLYTSSQRLSR